MINVDAMLNLMQGGDPAAVNLEADVASSDDYERLYGLRDQVVSNRDDASFEKLLDALRVDFCDLPDAEDRERVQQLVYGIIANPREIDDLNESELYAVHDVLINVGVMRTLLYSYGIEVGHANDDIFFDWYVRFHYYMVV